MHILIGPAAMKSIYIYIYIYVHRIEQTENATKDFEKAISLHKIATYNS